MSLEESTAASESTSAETSSPSTESSPQETSGSSEGATPGAEVAAPTWQPNWKFKAGGEEKEIPEWLRSSVKNQEHEKQLREFHEKVYGFDKLKGTTTKLEGQIQQVMPEYSSMKNTINKVVQFRDSGDLNSFFEATGVPKEAVAQWMLKELQLQELSAEQRAVYDNEQKLRKQNYALQDQVASLSQNATQGQMQAQASTLHTALAKPEAKVVSDSFNARMANPDAFWNFVCQQADAMERQTGKAVTAEQAVQESIRLLGPSNVPGQAQPGTTQNQAYGAASPTPPVIPNVSGRNTSPTKKVAKSIDDLRKMYKDMSKSG